MSANKKPSSGVVFLQRVRDDKVAMARTLRRQMTEAESVLWKELRGSRLAGLKFRRQQIIEGFIADFYCHSVNLVVEVDGPVHNTIERREYDEQRNRVFESRGIREIRFTNAQVMDDRVSVLDKIKEESDRD
jgi:very-short-patch-repair endonuclease